MFFVLKCFLVVGFSYRLREKDDDLAFSDPVSSIDFFHSAPVKEDGKERVIHRLVSKC